MIEAKEKKEIKAPSLYELTNDLQALLDFGFTEEDEEVFNDTLDGILAGIGDKADGYCAVIDRFNGNIDMIKAEEERLKVRREIIEKRVQTMKNALKEVLEIMEENGTEKPEIKTALHTIKLAKNGGVQPMEVNEDKVPDNFKKVILETDKNKIRMALEKGEKLDFAELKPRGRHVTIR
ncbi:MAG: siphovirus Gp157 family protein [Oscillospiraceae bacterium]|nr:siphovirus Gp157 family protein [Oscillospiraceae bacterium]